MALPDEKAVRERCYRCALRNWSYDGYVTVKRIAGEWLIRELPEYSLREICRLLHEFVEQGGRVDEQIERRPEYSHSEFHYDLRVRIGERRVYFETVLIVDDPADPDDPRIEIVSVHDV